MILFQKFSVEFEKYTYKEVLLKNRLLCESSDSVEFSSAENSANKFDENQEIEWVKNFIHARFSYQLYGIKYKVNHVFYYLPF